ncbi:MAG: phosphatidylserine decarboxylase family protein [Bacteroidales bacterium]|nr:phosphatidylserine decarboxylase family protein [Bacteroidales bacterium]
MHIHREGRKLISLCFLTIAILILLVAMFVPHLTVFHYLFFAVLIICSLLVTSFFRIPNRIFTSNESEVIAPADGKIVVIEDVYEKEWLKTECRQVSIFMSPANVHVNRYPVTGKIEYVRYHKGNYFIASHPKSSVLNEHSSVGIVMENGTKIFLRQIAGAMARRIVCYAKEGEDVKQNQELGFIKFGSRVDLFIPLDAMIDVDLEDVVKGGISPIAVLNEKPVVND